MRAALFQRIHEVVRDTDRRMWPRILQAACTLKVSVT